MATDTANNRLTLEAQAFFFPHELEYLHLKVADAMKTMWEHAASEGRKIIPDTFRMSVTPDRTQAFGDKVPLVMRTRIDTEVA